MSTHSHTLKTAASHLRRGEMDGAVTLTLHMHRKYGQPLDHLCQQIADQAGRPEAWRDLLAVAKRRLDN